MVASIAVRGGGAAALRLEEFQGKLCFQGKRKLPKILNDKKYFNTVKNFRASLIFRASASCSKILNNKKYIFNTVNSGHTVFQGKCKFFKNPECKKYI